MGLAILGGQKPGSFDSNGGLGPRGYLYKTQYGTWRLGAKHNTVHSFTKQLRSSERARIIRTEAQTTRKRYRQDRKRDKTCLDDRWTPKGRKV